HENCHSKFEAVLSRAKRLEALRIYAEQCTDALIKHTLVDVKYPSSLLHLHVHTTIHPSSLLLSLASCPSLISLRIRLGRYVSAFLNVGDLGLHLPSLRTLE